MSEETIPQAPTPPSHRAGIIRFGAIYFGMFMSMGAFLPFIGLLYRDAGFTGTDIGLASLVFPLSRILVPPLLGLLSDTRVHRTTVIRTSLILTLCAYPLLYRFDSFWSVTLALGLYSAARSPMIPLINSLCLEHLADTKTDFSAIRLWGSAGFIVGAILGGIWADSFGMERLPDLVGIAAVVLLFVAWNVPDKKRVAAMGKTVEPYKSSWSEVTDALSRLIRSPIFHAFAITVAASRIADAGYAIYYSMHVVDLGYSAAYSGWLWAFGVGSELILLAVYARHAGRFPLARVLTLTVLVSALRWLGIALAEDLVTLALLQLTHGITFGLYYVVSVEIMHKLTKQYIPATGQTIFDAITFGIAGIIGQSLGGVVYDHFGGAMVFYVGATIASVGVLAGLRLIHLVEADGKSV